MTQEILPKAKSCPICGKPADNKVMPFCSSRCAKIDLGRWFSETYTVETEEEPEQDESRD